MNLQTKALYNLLRLNRAQDPTIRSEEWQIEDLRSEPIDELFERLRKAGISLDKDSFQRFAAENDSPEDLTELLLAERMDPKQHDQIYLVVFELWRRLLPERPSLSVFCDELDNRISLYDAGQLESDEPIQDALSNLDEILDENADTGAKPSKIFEGISNYCAHDLISFIIDYISDLLDSGNQLYASELIEDFAPYAPEPIWFEFLRARLSALTDPMEANRLIEKILEKEKELSVDLLLEILRFQTGYGERSVFVGTVKKILLRIQTEEEFRELLELSAAYFRRRDREDLEKAVQTLLQKRKNLSGDLRSADPDLKAFEKLIPSH
jgi:hypothetical protein